MFQGRWRSPTAAAAIITLALTTSAFPADPPPAPAPNGAVTDAQVVAAMEKGIDYLLSVKKGDNWEMLRPEPMYKGGETALVLYALLHAGESLQDDPAYHSKLHWRSPDVAPVIAWLGKIRPQSTYGAGLEASALTLVPKLPDQKVDDGHLRGLEMCKEYVIEAMGHDGGYTYVSRLFDYKTGEPHAIWELWDSYCAAERKGDAAGAKKLKDEFDSYMTAVATQVGGQQWALASLVGDLKAEKKSAGPAEASRFDGDLRALEDYSKKMPKPPAPVDKVAEYNKQKKAYEELVEARRTGQLLDPKTNKMTPIAKDELEKRIAEQKTRVDGAEKDAKINFAPSGDLSNGQYGTLAAWALVDYGMELPNDYWTRTDRFWRLEQLPSGSWPYDAYGRDTTLNDCMGVVGIASLFICQEFLDTELRLVPKPDKNIDAGLAWLNQAYNPASTSMYYMYSVERVGLASGLKFFGTTEWYKEGAAGVLKQQKADGSWGGTVDTSYALLFLSRGRNPVVFNKLQYNGPWNARARDDAYVTRWMSKKLEKPINWQVVNLKVNPEDWLDAPILLITGSEDPKFTKDDIAKLRAYVNAGGMIFSTADGARPAFTNAIKKVAAELVDSKYEMRQLPRDHMLFSKELGADLPNPPPLIGMSNGSREIWIHSPQDIGADWQMRRYANKTNFELGAALYSYASGMASLRSKLQPLAVADSAAPAARTIAVAKVDYPGNSDPEPGAWTRMAKLAHSDFNTALNLNTVKFADLNGKKKYPLAALTGTARTTFTDDDAKALKNYLDTGGMLFVDATGGSTEFADSCRTLLKKVYPSESLTLLPDDHPIYTGSMPDSQKITDIDFRKFGNIRLKRRVSTPMLEAITVAGKTKVIFSSWDITSGFLGTNTWGVMGYAPNSAQALARNILLYAASPATQPKPSAN